MTHLRQAMLEELHRRNYAASTIAYYIQHVEQFARFFKRSPDRLTPTHLRTYQAHLLRERKLAPRTVRLHVCAIRFFFVKTLKRRYSLDDTPYPKAPRRLPKILSVDDVTHLINAAQNLSHRTMLMVLYLDRHAECRVAASAGGGHRQSAHADSHSAGQGRAGSLRPAQPDAAGDAARVLPVDATEDVALSWNTSRAGAPTRPSRRRSSGTRASSPPGGPACAHACRRICCAIPMPPISSKPAPICARSNCCWGMCRCGTRSSISTSRSGICKPSPIRWMRCRCRRPTPRRDPA